MVFEKKTNTFLHRVWNLKNKIQGFKRNKRNKFGRGWPVTKLIKPQPVRSWSTWNQYPRCQPAVCQPCEEVTAGLGLHSGAFRPTESNAIHLYSSGRKETQFKKEKSSPIKPAWMSWGEESHCFLYLVKLFFYELTENIFISTQPRCVLVKWNGYHVGAYLSAA